MGWESHHSRSTHPRHLGQHSANLSPATPMCLLSSPDSDLFLSAQGAGFNRPYTLNNYSISWCCLRLLSKRSYQCERLLQHTQRTEPGQPEPEGALARQSLRRIPRRADQEGQALFLYAV